MGEASDFFAERFAPKFFVLGVLNEVLVFEEVACFGFNHGVGKLTKELERVFSTGGV